MIESMVFGSVQVWILFQMKLSVSTYFYLLKVKYPNPCMSRRNTILILNIVPGLRIPSGDYPLGLLPHGRDIKTNEV